MLKCALEFLQEDSGDEPVSTSLLSLAWECLKMKVSSAEQRNKTVIRQTAIKQRLISSAARDGEVGIFGTTATLAPSPF